MEKTISMSDVVYLPENPAHDPEIECINAAAFGPGRFARAAYKVREGGPHERELSFVALHEGRVVGSVRQTPIIAGQGRGLLLGPLAVVPEYKNLGIGKRLMSIATGAARKAGWGAVVLVGDAPYYGPLGFVRVPYGQIVMPRPVDPERLLVCELSPGAAAALRGNLAHALFAGHAAAASQGEKQGEQA